MIISDYTEIELEHFRNMCNFVGHEINVFRMRSEGLPLETIAEEMNLSIDSVKKISRKVNRKINKVSQAL